MAREQSRFDFMMTPSCNWSMTLLYLVIKCGTLSGRLLRSLKWDSHISHISRTTVHPSMQDISLYTGVHVNGGPEAISKGSGPVRLAGLFSSA